MNTYIGPTVVEAATAKLNQIEHTIRELQAEAHAARVRIKKYQGSTMLEAERLASEAEVFQYRQLLACCSYCGCPFSEDTGHIHKDGDCVGVTPMIQR